MKSIDEPTDNTARVELRTLKYASYMQKRSIRNGQKYAINPSNVFALGIFALIHACRLAT